jgi:cyclic beta-1,2-glucan synthetase
LWAHGISGDLPIAEVTIGEESDICVVREMLLGHTYWRQHGLKADLLILNEASGGYERPLRERLARLVHGYSMYTGVDQPGGVFLRDVDQIPEEDVTLMLSAARVVLVAARGPMTQQLGVPGDVPELPEVMSTRRVRTEPSSPLPFLELSHANGLGGFTPDGREYVIETGAGDTTPAPWANVLANPEFGTLVTESGSGFTWYGNSQRNRVTPWSNDPISDPPGEAIYIRDEETGQFWTTTPLPIREEEGYRVRHGAGYSVFEHNSHAIEQTLTVFVPIDDDGGEPVRLQRLRLRNDSRKPKRLSVTFYAELVMGETRETSMAHVVTHWDHGARVLLARNRYNGDYGDRVVFATLSPAPSAHSGHRTSFIGRNGSLAQPAAMEQIELQGREGAGLDPCVALQVTVELAPGQRAEVTALLGEASSAKAARRLVRKYRESMAVDMALDQVKEWWDRRLSTIEVDVPEASAGVLLNRWLLYQTLSCRIWARSGFYQSGGAYGFRDQLQDVMALLYAAPDLARQHILRTARRQFRAGDVQHWWHPPSGAGVRTRISDDLLWLPYVVAQYVLTTGDAGILDEQLPFIEARHLDDAEHETFLVPAESLEQASLYEHCRRTIERGATSGPHGLPLIGTGDWNDGLNRVGAAGQGESVWLAWFLVDTLNRFADLSALRGGPEDVEATEEAAGYRAQAARFAAAVEEHGWDGEWYRRAYFDDGTPIGSTASTEAKIDSLPQSWAWLSDAADRDRAAQALESAWEHLVLQEEKMALLFTPPFDEWDVDPGYIKGYPPGVRENGGQYTHGALWLAMALARSGDGQHSVDLLQMLNPIEHTLNPEAVRRYEVEPYVVAADVYRLPGRVGRGGWTWYTGSAGWMYRAWIEEVLGIKIRGEELTVDPVIPASWDGFVVRYRRGEALFEITVENPDRVERGVVSVWMDGRPMAEMVIPLESGPVKHKVTVRMG